MTALTSAQFNLLTSLVDLNGRANKLHSIMARRDLTSKEDARLEMIYRKAEVIIDRLVMGYGLSRSFVNSYVLG